MTNDVRGQRFGSLVAMSSVSGNGRLKWECKCDCGGTAYVTSTDLRSGHTKSCGCKKIEALVARCTKHGNSPEGSRTKEYRTWAMLIQRCTNPNNPRFADYGGRGIGVCEAWRISFPTFLRDMGAAPSPQHQLDRRNNDLGYGPDNCRWATRSEQARNARRTRLATLNGVTKPVCEWADEVGLDPRHVRQRLDWGWPIEKALDPRKFHRFR